MTPFTELLGEENPILKSIEEKKFEIPTEIQEKAIPAVISGKDVIGGASTGSGKTLAFATGLIKNAKKDYGVQGLVLTPTRELAEQVATEIAHFSSDKYLNVIAVYGGVSINNQIRMLESAEVVVATPGRVLDHLERKTIDLSRVNTLVLDEADRMLDMGFIDDVDKIIAECPLKRQTMMFSATISSDIVHLSNKYLKDPVEVSAEQYVDPSKLEQVYYDISDNLKYSLFLHLLKNEKANLVMVFCNTRKNVDFVANNLKFMGIDALSIHGGFSQDKRMRILNDFHDNKVHVLVTTDVAARGLDIKGVSHVYNYDMPNDSKEYVHRIGRTARAGKEGKVINVISSRDYDNFQNIVSGDFEMKEMKAPYVKRVRIRWMPEKKGERFNRRNDMRCEREGRSFRGPRHDNFGGGFRGGFGRRDEKKHDSRGFSRGGSRGNFSKGRDSGFKRGDGPRRDDKGFHREGTSRNFGRDNRRGSSFGRCDNSDRREGGHMDSKGGRVDGRGGSRDSRRGDRRRFDNKRKFGGRDRR